MEGLIKNIMPTLIAAAIVACITAIWRFESVAGEVKELKERVKENYTKKEEFVVVKNDIKYIKERQAEVKDKVELILEAVRK